MKIRLRSKFSFLKNSIRTRLILLFFISTTTIFAIAGYYLNWQIRATLDRSLGQNVEKLAASFALQIDDALITFIQPGDEESRTYRNLKNQLHRFLGIAGVNRIYMFDVVGRSIVDSDSMVRIGLKYTQLNYNQQEIARVFSGATASSVLFKGIGGTFFKTGFAPIFQNERVVAGLAVVGSAGLLDAVTSIQNDLLLLGLLVIMGSIFLGWIVASRITTPLKKLQRASQKISQGYFHQRIPDFGKDEVGFLSKTMEQMRENILTRDKRQQAMLAGVAHEIRNPLGGIELFAGLLANEIENDDLKKYAQKILAEVHNLKAIIQGFLDYARPIPANKMKTEIKSVWDEVLFLLAGELERTKITFQQQDGVDPIFVDPQHLKQVFLNLMKNSLAVLKSNGTIFVEIVRVDDQVKIVFSDSGPGIPAEFQRQIFEPFFTTHEKGTGLGLAVVKNLVEENGGVIQYRDGQEGGACFVITFPIELMRR